MKFARTTSGYKVWFFVEDSNGDGRDGLVQATDYEVYVIEPGGTDISPTVSNFGGGMYSFDISSSFFATYDIGEYVIYINVDSTDIPYVKANIIDTLQVGYQDFNSTLYPEGIFVSSERGTNSTVYPYGTREFPTTSIANAQTIISDYSLGTRKITITDNGSYALTAELVDYMVYAEGHFPIINLNGQTMAGTTFQHCTVAGSGSPTAFIECQVIGWTGTSVFFRCVCVGSLTVTASVNFIQCAMVSAQINFGSSGEHGFFMSDGRTYITSMTGGTVNHYGNGYLEFYPGCSNGTYRYAGNLEINDNSTGTFTPVRLGAIPVEAVEAMADAVWDEGLSGHNISGSAGIAMQRTMFGEMVCLDPASGSPGTAFPLGTHTNPVNNWVDAKAIAEREALNTILAKSSWTVGNTDNISNYTIMGDNAVDVVITLEDGCVTTNTTFQDISVEGYFNGRIFARHCNILQVHNFKGYAFDSLFYDDVLSIAADVLPTSIIECKSGKVTGTPMEINIGGNDIIMLGWKGPVKFTGKTGSEIAYIELMTGDVRIGNTCTGGEIILKGTGRLEEDLSGPGCTVTTIDLIGSDTIPDLVWDEDISDHLTVGTTGKKLYDGGTGDPAEIAGAVWDAVRASYTTPGTFGATDEWASAIDADGIASAVWDALKNNYGTPGTMGWLVNLIESGILGSPRIIPGD